MHQHFLMRTSILQAVEPEAAEVAAGLDGASVARLIAESERLGLLSRRQGATRQGHRYHPLVREFLETRMRREIGDAEVDVLHRNIAVWSESRDWKAACFHYAAARDAADLHRMLDASIESIVGTGRSGPGGWIPGTIPAGDRRASFEVIRSRFAAKPVDIEAAVAHAQLAVEVDPNV